MAMNGLSKMAVAAATALLLVLTIVPGAVAVTYTIEWTTGVDYSGWATGKTFRVGDILEFKYGSSHTVDVVDKAGYDGCDASSSTENHSDGDTKIDLKTVGINYFICSTPGHCSLNGGMKLAVNVVAGSADLRTPTPPSSTPGTPTTPESPPSGGSPTPTTPTPGAGSTSPPPPPKASGASKGVMSYVLVGVSMVLGYGLWM
nr:blue copper-binding protein II [Arabidopsis thaliana]